MQYFGKTDKGFVRKNNEDSFLVQQPLFVVADGMGGHAAGEVASKMVVDCISSDYPDYAGLSPEQALARLLELANHRILEYGTANASQAGGLGTTATAVFVGDNTGWWAHCGDSRLYLHRNGKLLQITEDHTLVDQMVRNGLITRSEAASHPQKNIITRALGAEEYIEADTGTVNLEKGDKLLLCSDGLTNMVSEPDIERIICQPEKSIELRVSELIDLAKINGGVDNITVVLVEI